MVRALAHLDRDAAPVHGSLAPCDALRIESRGETLKPARSGGAFRAEDHPVGSAFAAHL
jgi:hypothetical protein